MSRENVITTTVRMPRELHRELIKYVADYNYNIKWDKRKMSIALLTAKAITEYLETHKNIKQEVANESKSN